MAYYWRSAMIALAQSHMGRRWVQGFGPSSLLANRYVAGADVAAGAARAQALLTQDGIRASLCFLGESSDVPDWPAKNTAMAIAMTEALARAGLDIHFSMDPTQAGHHVDPALARDNLRKVAAAIGAASADKAGVHMLMLGMEEATLTEAILALYRDLRAEGLPVGVTLQAYRRRSEADLMPLIRSGAKVRLVRGAYPAGGDIAFARQEEIAGNWRRLIDLMFSAEALAHGFYPIIATHDHAIQAYASDCAAANGWRKGAYEIEMLLGIRDGLARQLARQGERMRLYLPFGVEWWPYTFRRIGDNPRNAWILLRSLVMGER